MAKYKVREHFHVRHGNEVHGPGAELELSPEQHELVAHQVEPVEAPKPATKKAAAPAA